LGFPVVYYISPQVWAWRAGRVRQIARVVDRMLLLFDFEEAIYRKAGVDVRWVGHPLADQIPDPGMLPREAGLVGLLPGSRPKEVARLLPILARSAVRISSARPGTRFVVAPTPSVSLGLVKDILARVGLEAEVRPGGARDLMRSAELLLIASGTATLEAALCRAPMVVVYKVSPVTALIGRALIRMKEFALANILSGGGTVPECIQERATPEIVAREDLALLGDPSRREAMRGRLGEVRKHLGPPGASRRAAEAVLEIARKGVLGPDPEVEPHARQGDHSEGSPSRDHGHPCE
jgi:lipid-A-disaccharide synthase